MMDDMTSRLAAFVDEVLPLLRTIRDELYRRPEIGGEEAFASARLAGVLEDGGFAVDLPYGGIPYAFRAAASGGDGPKVALFAEYDALPDLGHACGHNLICTAALDAAVECYRMIRAESAKYPEANVHGIIDEGGKKPGVIPDHSSLKYLTRAWDMKTLEDLRSMVERCAGQAAASTGCTYRVHNYEPTNRSMRTNRRIAQVFDEYLSAFGEPEILRQDIAGSTDMADVSWRVPAIRPWVGLNCPGTELHTRAFAERTLSPEADQFLARCAKALSCTAARLLMDRVLLASVREEFRDSSF